MKQINNTTNNTLLSMELRWNDNSNSETDSFMGNTTDNIEFPISIEIIELP